MGRQMRLAPTRLALLLLAACAGAQAQQVYRIVGPDGRVTFSDRPAITTEDRAAAATPVEVQPVAPAIDTGALPYDLRQVAQRYPVTLYTSPNCGPCGDARSLLRGRGIPFLEKTVSTQADVDALTRISGGSNVPFATIGSQQLQGYASPEWTQYLDLAGYPKQSALPSNYRAPAAAPLVAVVPARPAPRPAAAAAPRQQPQAAPATNPAGIQF